MSQDTTNGSNSVQPPAPGVPAAGPLPGAVPEEELMNSGHELPEGYTCPLCCLPIALPMAQHSSFEPCCMKTVCNGCTHASRKRGMGESCSFCRAPTPDSDAAIIMPLVRKRVDAEDPTAMDLLAGAYYHGNYGLKIDIPRAIELWTEAACLGDSDAHFQLGHKYYYGEGIEKDMARGIQHWQHAAIQGHPQSRYMLGVHERNDENHELAAQHLIVSAKMGYERSLNGIKAMFMDGHATKAQYAEALRGYQDALEETKSPQREEAKAFLERIIKN
ncbi:hypothetical protein THAOC_36223 [Thalassiosira oceanica]|uniref:RING-type domain-containing protein n=1 Tax=Thalassiosira oceanica TaxID=159749 RepID=K0RF78_THAOC|nr:hypothetical protein THAOC_36223 [Thalassiosira oceanica]|eukprot:EJK45177.1 hypothetical protein THAOC_36223 [Thalassiosira oceanica]